MKKLMFLAIAFLQLFISCKEADKCPPLLNARNFETVKDGKPIALYTLESGNGVYMQVTNYGARVVTLWMPDKDGNYEDIVIGFENIERYLNNDGGERYFGPVVGRFANRIAAGKFEIDGVEYQLSLNNKGQSLHGGLKGLDGVVWEVIEATRNQIKLAYTSPDGEEGYPGTVNFTIVYTLTPDNEFKLTYHAVTDQPTIINLSHHGLFNLKGEGNGTITDNLLTINASHTTPVDSVLIPTGEITLVQGTPFDFRAATLIGERINEDNIQLKNGSGYDHNWVIDRANSDGIEHVATLYEPVSGRGIEIWSDQPGLQFYSGNFFNGSVKGKYGKTLNYREGLALETQKFPDSPNHPNFPSTRLNPGEEYTQTCIYKLFVK